MNKVYNPRAQHLAESPLGCSFRWFETGEQEKGEKEWMAFREQPYTLCGSELRLQCESLPRAGSDLFGTLGQTLQRGVSRGHESCKPFAIT